MLVLTVCEGASRSPVCDRGSRIVEADSRRYPVVLPLAGDVRPHGVPERVPALAKRDGSVRLVQHTSVPTVTAVPAL